MNTVSKPIKKDILHHHDQPGLSPIEDIIKDVQAGQPVIIVDDENRENEGDLIIAAEKATADNINFMAKEGRGLICLPMEGQMVDRLKLELMGRGDNARHRTAFTVSIEAKEGVTTGISAADRAHTIQTAISSKTGPEDIATPGHVFPLRARDGGVLVRAGHTEAAVDLAKLAGFSGAGVICEIMNDDGSMARLPDLIAYARKHNLKIGTIADLIAYRRRYETFIECVSSTSFNSVHAGAFEMYVYANKLEYQEHIALVKGDIRATDEPVLVRMHAVDIFVDILREKESTCLEKSMKLIDEKGMGVIVLLRNTRPRLASDYIHKQKQSGSPGAPKKNTLKDYGIGAQILRDLGVKNMILLTNNPKNIIGLDGYGLYISEYQSISQP